MSKREGLAYLAGYIDADGHISLYFAKYKNCYCIEVSITASRRDILEELEEIAGIKGYIWTRKNKKGAKRYCSSLKYDYQKACKVLEMVQPYLRLKGAQAVLCIQVGLHRRRFPHGRGFNYNAYYDPRYEEMKRLNEGNKSDLIR
ncbi:unnamed protein product [marine sediment metagenome]|uniref:Homing endonuclease LAGLIDADG domain-containing protein n=1 Tax=marine sediment metagenome TaxID=412755 RepID=X1HUJ6_9ZZZZ